MKKILLILILLAVAISGIYAQKAKKKQKKKEYIECLYFHRTNACASCVEMKKCLQEVWDNEYPRDIKKGKIVYHRIDYEKNTDNKLVRYYNISRPVLYLVYYNNGKKTIIDITADGFKYAKYQPEKFKSIVKEHINTCFR